ncbi:hypothetical protein KJ632_00590 [Patescibacteria group bacterium]|nr:hypothetical protein [Patescibacteria group bacterium]
MSHQNKTAAHAHRNGQPYEARPKTRIHDSAPIEKAHLAAHVQQDEDEQNERFRNHHAA